MISLLISFTHRVPKGRHQTHGGNSVNSPPIFKFFSLSNSPVNLQKNVYCETLMAENERQSQTNSIINDKT